MANGMIFERISPDANISTREQDANLNVLKSNSRINLLKNFTSNDECVPSKRKSNTCSKKKKSRKFLEKAEPVGTLPVRRSSMPDTVTTSPSPTSSPSMQRVASQDDFWCIVTKDVELDGVGTIKAGMDPPSPLTYYSLGERVMLIEDDGNTSLVDYKGNQIAVPSIYLHVPPAKVRYPFL